MRFFTAILSLVLLLASSAVSEDVNGAPPPQGEPIAAPPPQDDPDVVQIAQVGVNPVTAAPPIQELTTPAPEILSTTAEPEIVVVDEEPDILPVTAAPEDDVITTPAPDAEPTFIERLRKRFNEIRKVFQEQGFLAAARYFLRLDPATKRAMLRANPSLFDVEDLKLVEMVRELLTKSQKSSDFHQ